MTVAWSMSLLVMGAQLAHAAEDDEEPPAPARPAPPPPALVSHSWLLAGSLRLHQDAGLESPNATRPLGGSAWGLPAQSVTRALGFGYFVTEHLSLGLQVGLLEAEVYEPDRDFTSGCMRVTILPTIGYGLGLSHEVTLWPHLGMGWVLEDQWYRAGTERNRFEDHADFLLSLPVLYHPWRHVFFGVGPAFEASIEDEKYLLSAEVSVGAAL